MSLTMNRITNLLLLLIVTSLLLPATGIMYANGSPENDDESDTGSMDNDDMSDTGSMDNDDTLNGGPTGTNNAFHSGPTGTNNALNPLSSGFRIESNSTGVCSPGNVCFSGGGFRRDHAVVHQPRARSSWSSAAHVEQHSSHRRPDLCRLSGSDRQE